MIENKIFEEIPIRANFHSAVMTTFSFDFHHFEAQVLKPLLKKGIININVFADARMLDETIGSATGNLRSVNSKYNINAITSTGAFHPKLTLLVGENDVMLIQGSGNITSGGHGKNHEMFNVLYANKDNHTQLELINEAWHYIKMLTNKVKGVSKDKLNWVSDNCSLLTDKITTKHSFINITDGYSLALLYNEETSIWKQIQNLIDPNEIKSIKVFSPFYDEKGTFLTQLSEYFGNCKIESFLQDGKGIHPYKMESKNNIEFYTWGSTNISSKEFKSYGRKLHSKIFVLETKKEQYCIIGSPNATIKAFGSETSRGVNDEFAVIYKTNDVDFVDVLGLNGEYIKTIPTEIKEELNNNSDSEEHITTTSQKVKILGVDKDLYKITLYLINKNNYDDIVCKLYNTWGEEIETHSINIENKSNVSFKIENLKQENSIGYIQIFDNEGDVISSKHMVNKLGKLLNTNPSTENRKLLKLTSLIESGSDDVFEILTYMNDVFESRESKKSKTKHSISTELDNEKDEEEEDNNLSFEEAVEQDGQEESNVSLFGSSNTTKVWEAIELFIRKQIAIEQESEIDDEEQADASKGRERKEPKKDRPILSSRNVLENRRKQIKHLFDNYISVALNTSSDNELKTISISDYAMFLIMLQQLLRFTLMDVELKNKDVEESEKVVMYPVLGNYHIHDNFIGTLLNLVGNMVSIIYKYETFKPKDEYSQVKIENYAITCRNLTLYTLAIAKHTNIRNNASDWLDLLAVNIMHKLGKPIKSLEKNFEDFARLSNFEDISTEDIILTINKWMNITVESDLSENKWFDKRLGLCYISKTAPLGSENPKFIQLSRPGFEYSKNEKAFIKPEFMNVKTGEFLRTKQSIKK